MALRFDYEETYDWYCEWDAIADKTLQTIAVSAQQLFLSLHFAAFPRCTVCSSSAFRCASTILVARFSPPFTVVLLLRAQVVAAAVAAGSAGSSGTAVHSPETPNQHVVLGVLHELV